MNRLRSKYMIFGLLWILCAALFFVGCEKGTDGPLKVSEDDFSYDGDGFFAYARLDSGKTIHLSKDTLYLDMGKMYTFSNCALKDINLSFNKVDSVLWIAPTLSIHATAEDCAAPFYRPDTTLKMQLTSEQMKGVGVIKVKNDADTALDSIILRRGNIKKDTFYVYLAAAGQDAESLLLMPALVGGSGTWPEMTKLNPYCVMNGVALQCTEENMLFMKVPKAIIYGATPAED